MKKALYIILWVVFSGAILTLLGFVSKEKNTILCSGLEVNIDRPENNYFILEGDVREMFFNMGYRVENQILNMVDTRKIEKQMTNNPSVQTAEVYTTVDGKVKIDIRQRKPVLRVYNESGESFYIDEEGWLMPLSEKFTARVLVANGNILETYSERCKKNILSEYSGDSVKSVLSDLFLLTKYIKQSEFWNSQITQLYVNGDREIELIPRVGNHVILLGDISDLEEKFEKLMIFYRKGLEKVGWNAYSQINLKFKNQVVCKKIISK